MPKERVQQGRITIRTEQPGTEERPGAIIEHEWHPGEPFPDGSSMHEQPSIDISWNRDAGWVQLAFDAPREWWDGFREAIDGSPGTHEFSAFSEVLSRKEINHMIRTLRRARDSAYGSDE